MREWFTDFINCIIILFTPEPCKKCIVRPMCSQRCKVKILPLPGLLSKFIAFSNILANLILIGIGVIAFLGFLEFIS